MFILRFISFSFKMIGTFFIVFILQIQFDGKTLEKRLVGVGKKILLVQVLNQTSEDSIKFLRFFSKEDRKKIERKLSNKIDPRIKDFQEKIKILDQ